MRRHVHVGNHAAESFVSFIPLFGRLADTPTTAIPAICVASRTGPSMFA
jgi:hypothetical protein